MWNILSPVLVLTTAREMKQLGDAVQWIQLCARTTFLVGGEKWYYCNCHSWNLECSAVFKLRWTQGIGNKLQVCKCVRMQFSLLENMVRIGIFNRITSRILNLQNVLPYMIAATLIIKEHLGWISYPSWAFPFDLLSLLVRAMVSERGFLVKQPKQPTSSWDEKDIAVCECHEILYDESGEALDSMIWCYFQQKNVFFFLSSWKSQYHLYMISVNLNVCT